MTRWASCWLILGAVALGAAQASYSAEIQLWQRHPAPVRVAPFGGALVAAQPLRPPVPPPVPPGWPSDPMPRPMGGRPIRPPAPTPGGPLKQDLYGDPLPAGAVARLGTVRLRHGGEPIGMSFTPDGKLLATVSNADDGIRLWDPVSGKEVHRLNAPVVFAAFARDGSVVFVDDADRGKVWNPALNMVRELPEKTLPEGTTVLAVHPDGRTLAAGAQKRLAIIDLQTGKTRTEYKLPGDQPPTRLVYSPDGRWLAGTGQKAGVWLWDTNTGKRVRTYQSPVDFTDFSFSPDSTRIAIAAEMLRVYSTDSEETDDGYGAPEGTFLNPRFSPDGKFVFAQSPDGDVVRINAETGEQKDKWEPPDPGLHQPATLSPDGTLAAAVDQSGGIRIWEPKTGKGPDVERLPILSDPGLSADGKTASCLDANNRIRYFDPVTGKSVKVIDVPVEEGTPVSYDARTGRAVALVGGADESELYVLDVTTGKVLAKLPGTNMGLASAVFHPTDRDKIAVLTPGAVAIHSLATGKQVRGFAFSQPDGNAPRGAFSPDGRLLALSTFPLTVWEVSTGKKRFEIDAIANPMGVVFSPDGRLLAAWDGADTVILFDVRTGTTLRRFQLPGADGSIATAVFTPDSKRLVTGGIDGLIVFWDTTNGEAVMMLDRHDGALTGLAFSADGNRLLSTAADGTALVWDVTIKPEVKVAAPVGGADEAFRLLAVADPIQAQRGIEFLYRKPADAVKYLGEKVPMPTATPAEKIARLVADLASDDFQTRQGAARELEAIGAEAIPAVRAAVEKSPRPEVKKLAGEVLGKLEGPPTRPDDLRAIRAVEVLEVIGTPEARDVLKKWAAGPPGHRLSIEAAAAMGRLAPK